MKDHLINKYFDSRAKMELALKKAGLSTIGSRQELYDRLKNLPYGELKKLIP